MFNSISLCLFFEYLIFGNTDFWSIKIIGLREYYDHECLTPWSIEFHIPGSLVLSVTEFLYIYFIQLKSDQLLL